MSLFGGYYIRVADLLAALRRAAAAARPLADLLP
jgi:hypothetical protein